MHKIPVTWAALVAASLLVSCSSVAPQLQSKGRQVEQIIDDYFEQTLRLFPLFATSIGDHRFDDQLTISITPEARAQYLALVTSSLNRVRALGCDDLEGQERLSCLTFVADMEAAEELERHSLGHLLPFDQFSSFFSDFAELAAGSSYVPFNTEKHYENFLARMHKVPAYIDAMVTNMREGIQLQVTTPRVLVDKALKQLQDLLPEDPRSSVFYKPLLTFDQKIKAPASKDLKTRYEASIRNEIYPAYRRLEEFVRKEYRPAARTTHGLLSVPGGRKYYQALVRTHTTLNIDPGEIMQIGLSEVARITKLLEEAKLKLGFDGTLKEFFKSLRNNPKLTPFRTSEQVLDGYRQIQGKIAQSIPRFFNLQPKAPFEIREIEKFRAESAAESYQNPSPDGSRPGIFWVPVPHPEKYNAKSMETIFLHEAIPGHHFQISIQQELSNLSRYRRFGGNNAYVEGWALYTESLGKELGLFTDPYQWIGRLEWDMHRAIRLVVDVGMHWKGWTRERAIRYSLDNEPLDEAGITAEIERYLAIPGQALSYKMGEQKILQLKSLAKKRLGNGFREPEFHDQVLKDGALPLSVFEAGIKKWIDAKSAAL